MILDQLQAIQRENETLRRTLADIRDHIKVMRAEALDRDSQLHYVAVWDAIDAAIGKS